MSWLRHGWKRYERRWLIQRPYPQGVRGVNSISAAQDMSQDGCISAVFLQLLKDGPFQGLLQTLVGKFSKANIWLLTSSPTMKPFPAEWSHALLIGGPRHIPHNFILIAKAPSPPTQHLDCEFSWTETHYLCHVNSTPGTEGMWSKMTIGK